MGRLSVASRAILALLAIVVTGCGPTAEALTTPTPIVQGPVLPTEGGPPTAVIQPSAAPGTTGEPGTIPAPQVTSTSIPLTTPSPLAGQVWQPLPDFPAAAAFEVTSVTALVDGGFNAVGFGAMSGEGFFGRRQGVVWTSSDGRSWQSIVDPVFQFVTLEETIEFARTLFVFGTIETCDLNLADDCVEPPDAGWAGWRRAGGTAWERLPLPVSMQAGTMDGVIATSDRLVAFGWTGDESQPIVWSSVDGLTWSETTDLAGMDPVTAMAAGPAGVVAFGPRYSDELGDLELLAAISSDAAHFGRVTAPALMNATMQSVTMGASGLVAVGDRDDEDLNLNGVALHSADGLAWTETTAADGSFGGALLEKVHSVPNGYVAVGIVPLPDEFGISAGASWFSADGLSWLTLAPFGERFSQLDASAAGSTGIVAFTVTEEEPDEETVVSTISAWFAPIEAFAGQ